jgi:hypothetical protein
MYCMVLIFIHIFALQTTWYNTVKNNRYEKDNRSEHRQYQFYDGR